MNDGSDNLTINITMSQEERFIIIFVSINFLISLIK